MGDKIPVTRQVRRSDGTVYQAVRHMKTPDAEGQRKGWVPPRVSDSGTGQLNFANIHHSLSQRGYSDSNISFAIDISINKAQIDPEILNSTKIMTALNDCEDALGEGDYSFADEETQKVAERVVIASINRIPANERVQRLVQNPDIDLDRLIRLVNEDGVTDPAKLEVILISGGATSLSDGAL